MVGGDIITHRLELDQQPHPAKIERSRVRAIKREVKKGYKNCGDDWGENETLLLNPSITPNRLSVCSVASRLEDLNLV
jgi:hypothetical protein